MKISKLFHWLYACLMLLPLVVAPIFAIYSHRHTIDSYSVVALEDSHYNLKQLVYNGKPTSLDGWGGDLSFDNNSLFINSDGGFSNEYYFDIFANHQYYFTFSSNSFLSSNFSFYFDGNYGLTLFNDDVPSGLSTQSVIVTSLHDDSDCVFSCDFDCNDEDCYLNNIMLFDLTQIFGSGNEPSQSEFENLLTQDYYDYGVFYDIIYGTHSVSYNDTDIGSQFIYQLYNVEKNYFNFTSVFGLNAFGNWLYQNWFNSASYIGFYLFYYLFTYWLVISICWLLFDLLMYVPNLAHRWLDKGALE